MPANYIRVRRERSAAAFDEVARLIESGEVRVRHADPGVTLDPAERAKRLRARADGIRAGTDRARPTGRGVRKHQ